MAKPTVEELLKRIEALEIAVYGPPEAPEEPVEAEYDAQDS